MQEREVVDTFQHIMNKYFEETLTEKETMHELIKLDDQIKKAPIEEVQT